ncbi:MAG: FAD-binding protein, partial [Elusimicrobia bacterium]|nr:FAD-binding protein [Elusimicrobiota bacterium]
PKYSDMAGLAPRDIVARAIDAELKKSGEPCVFLDMTGLPSKFLKKRFPKIYQTCLECGIDITEKPIPVVPAAHFFCGGILAATDGKTAMPGLYAIGETACTGLHGANRLASNSLLEAFAMAGNAFESIKSALKNTAAPPLSVDEWNTGSATQSDEAVVIAQNWDEIRTLMWNYVGIIRSDKRLERAKKRIALISEEIRQYYWDFVLTRDLIELRNIACLAEQIVRCASYRRESRGLHYNIDCPKPSAQWQKPTIIDRYINELH